MPSEFPSQFFSFPEHKRPDPAEPLEYISQEEAASLATYPLKEPQILPQGYRFSYAIFFPENQNILMVYAYEQAASSGEMIMLTLSPTLIREEVGPEAYIDTLTINGNTGEVVQGGWIALAGEDWESWESRMPVTTLRWFDGDLYIKLQFHLNESSSPSYIDSPMMLAIAESVSPITITNSQPTPLPTLEGFNEMEGQVGYDLLEPGILPDGFELALVEQVPGSRQVYAQFYPPDSGENGPRLSISQIPLSTLSERTPQSYPPEVEIVDILRCEGRLMEGVNDASGSYPSWWLFWENQELAISLWYYPGLEVSEEGAKELMIEIAKSMQ
jgi:hypothetical protein